MKRIQSGPNSYLWGKGTLEQLFESLAKVKLMKFFFRNSIDAFQIREIFKMYFNIIELNSNGQWFHPLLNQPNQISNIWIRKYWFFISKIFDRIDATVQCETPNCRRLARIQLSVHHKFRPGPGLFMYKKSWYLNWLNFKDHISKDT